MDKQHGLIDIDNFNYNIINIDSRVLNIVQRKANICFKMNGVANKLSELKNSSNIDIKYYTSKLNFLLVNMNNDIQRLLYIDRELDIIISNLQSYANSMNLVKRK